MIKKLINLLILGFIILGCTQNPIENPVTPTAKTQKLKTPIIVSASGNTLSKDDYISFELEFADSLVYYTLDQSEPNMESGILYIGSFQPGKSTDDNEVMVRVRAYKTGFLPSDIAEKIFSINETQQGISLSELEIDVTLDKDFSSEILQYYSNVPFSKESVTLKVKASSEYTSITCNDVKLVSGVYSNAISLNVGKNPIKIIISDSAGSKTYNIEITRQSAVPSTDNNLSSILYSAGELEPAFSSSISSYSLTLSSETETVLLTASTVSSLATVTINGLSSPLSIDMKAFANKTAEIIVTAESGAKKTYTINIVKEISPLDPVLSELTVSTGSLSPSFSGSVYSYTVSLPYDKTSITVNADTTVDGVVIKANNKTLPASILLSVGKTTIEVVADNGKGKTLTYTIVVTRQEENQEFSDNANLSSLTANSAFSPVFNKNTLSYSAEVAESVSSIKINIAKEDSKASVSINGEKCVEKTIALVTGLNVINILVTAEDNVTTKTYTLSITRKSLVVTGKIIVHVSGYKDVYYWQTVEINTPALYTTPAWPGVPMTDEGNGWYGFTFEKTTSTKIIFTNNTNDKTADLSLEQGEWWFKDGKFTDYNISDSVPPVISLISPTNGATLTNVINFQVEASDNVGVDKVVYYANDVEIVSALAAPFNVSWDSGLVPNGAQVLHAKAYDKAGNSSLSAYINVTTNNSNRPPVCNAGKDITAIKGSAVSFNGSASYDPNGTIVSYSWSNGINGVTGSKTYNEIGKFYVVLTVTDNDGASATDTVTVTIVDIIPHRDFRDETVYFMMTDRFADGNKSNNNIWGDEYLPNGESQMYDYDENKTGILSYYHGGDFDGIINNLDYLENMGFTAIWITPVVKQPEGRRYNTKDPYEASAFHGYWGYDFDQIDPHLHSSGKNNDGWADFDALVAALHARGMKLMLDIVVNHGQPGDSVKGSKSKWADKWDKIIMNGQTWTFDKTVDPLVEASNPLSGFFSYPGTGNTWLIDLLDFNGNGGDKGAMPHLKEVYKRFIDHGVDAFRIDTVAYMSHDNWVDFTKAMNDHAKSIGNDHFYMVGEAWTGDRNGDNNAADIIYGDKGSNNFHMLDLHNSSMDFPGWLGNVFKGDRGFEDTNVAKIFGAQGDLSGRYEPTYLGTFVDNHDVFRANGILSKAQYINNLNYIYLFRGVPIVYYGTEAMYSWNGAHATTNKEDICARWMLGDQGINHVKTQQPEMYKHLKMLNALRRESEVLRKGQQTNLRMNGGEAVIRREYEGKKAYIGMSIRDAAFTYEFTGITDGAYTLYTPDTANATFNKTTINVSGGSYTMNIPANSFAIIQK